ncbi:MAG: anaerobic ribonucleoside-triphosphate reductase activating protein [Eubacterium sp.]|nr:anaerobic ribonucleoside-triphosphate reductase activating protein [Eubacterium sp.]
MMPEHEKILPGQKYSGRRNKGEVMNYAEIKYFDIANGPGVRTSLFVSGCTHHCKECFNRETWDFKFGKPFTEETENEIIESLKPAYVAGLTLLGGEPWEPANQRALLPFLRRVRKEVPEKSIWSFSGYVFEDLTDPDNKRCHTEVTDELLGLTDVLVDGEFQIEKKNIELMYRGSENQRIIDLGKTLREGRIIQMEEYIHKGMPETRD